MNNAFERYCVTRKSHEKTMAGLEDLENFNSDTPNVLLLSSDLVREEHHDSQYNNISVGWLREYKPFLLPHYFRAVRLPGRQQGWSTASIALITLWLNSLPLVCYPFPAWKCWKMKMNLSCLIQLMLGISMRKVKLRTQPQIYSSPSPRTGLACWREVPSNCWRKQSSRTNGCWT